MIEMDLNALLATTTDQTVIDAAMKIRTALSNPNLTNKDRKQILKRLQNFVHDTDAGRKPSLGVDVLNLRKDPQKSEPSPTVIGTAGLTKDDLVACYEDLLAWMSTPLRMERPQGSATHKLREAWMDRKVVWAPGTGQAYIPPTGDLFGDLEVFVVEHDWHGAMRNASDFEGGEFRFPYDDQCFEFRFSGRRVIALVTNFKSTVGGNEVDGPICWPFVETPFGWVMPDYIYSIRNGGEEWGAIIPRGLMQMHGLTAEKDLHFTPLLKLIADQTRAICIALEAEAAVTETERAPYRLNAQREKKGKLPLYDYHVVKLNRRAKPSVLPDDHQPAEGRRRRMHMVRGHMRHYENHKTWIKWHFRGDPDLGFIEKEYRL